MVVDDETPPGLPEPPPPPPHAVPGEEPAPAAMPVERRPDGMSIAIGAGWALPSGDLLAPNITSVRLRLGSGLTFEPLLTLSRSSHTDDDGTDAITTSVTDLGLSVLARYPYRVSDRVDLSLCAELGLEQTSTDREAMMPDTTELSIGLRWGLALDYWVKRHVAVSLTALNPFASLSKTSTDNMGLETSSSSNQIGIIFDPQIYLTIHLYL